MIDLSKYLGKVVKVTLKNDETYTGLIFRGKEPMYGDEVIKFSFNYNDSIKTILNYFNDGLNYYQVSAFDIIKIELVTLEQPMTINALDSKTLNTITTALIPGVINYIESHEKYAELMQSLIKEYVENNLGNVNVELPFMIFDKINLNNVE
jgi:hypothetical protein